MYIALYRKWRPLTFDDVIGQKHITDTLKNQIIQEKTAHAYLLTGTRGTGKTTCAKILAMAFNCTDIQDGNPCLKCTSCLSILEGNNLDVDEIDAASNNRVDNVRQLREDAIYLPATSKFRVFIIDETHMLTNEAFNALLKIMEEPPVHVKFILATTEAHKVPATILSRCQRFDFMRIKSEDIAQRILHIADVEKIDITQSAAELIAKLADGGMRDGLSILDQCISYAQHIDNDVVVTATGVTPRDYLFDMTNYILKGDSASAVKLLSRLYNNSKDMVSFCEELIIHFRNIMILKTGDQTNEIIAVLPEELAQLKTYVEKVPMKQAIGYISLLQETLDHMNRFSDKRLNMEIGLVRLTSPRQERSNEATQIEETVTSKVDNTDTIANLTNKIAQLEQMVIKLGKAVTARPVVEAGGKEVAVSENKDSGSKILDAPEDMSPTNNGQDDVAMEILPQWKEILTILAAQDKFIHSIVYNATVYVHNEFLYIQSPMRNMAQLLKTDGNSARLVRLIEEVTKTRYKIRIMRNTVASKQPVDPLDELVQRANDAGIDLSIN